MTPQTKLQPYTFLFVTILVLFAGLYLNYEDSNGEDNIPDIPKIKQSLDQLRPLNFDLQ